MQKYLDDIRRPSSPDHSVNPLGEVENAEPNDESPTQVSETMIRRVKGESGNVIGFNAISDETARGVSVQCDHEEEGLSCHPW